MRRELPSTLCRVTLPESLKTEAGYFLPHKQESDFGKSVPLIDPRQWLNIAHFFGHPSSLGENGFFILLVFKSSELEEVKPVPPASLYNEFYALAPTSALLFAGKYSWTKNIPTSRYPYKPIFLGDYKVEPEQR